MTSVFERCRLWRLSALVQAVDAVSGRMVTTLGPATLAAGVALLETRRDEARVLVINARGPLTVLVEAEGYVSQVAHVPAAAEGQGVPAITVKMAPAFGAALPASASYLTGRVIDANSQRPVSGAEIRIQGLPVGAYSKFRSAASGYFLAAWPAQVFKSKTAAPRVLSVAARAALGARTLRTERALQVTLYPKPVSAQSNSWRSEGPLSIELSEIDN